MPTKVRQAGIDNVNSPVDGPYRVRKATLRLSNGNVIAVIADRNLSTAPVGWGERNNTSKIYLYESSDRTTWTLRATITLATQLDDTAGSVWSSELFSNNDIGIVYRVANGDIKYRKVTYATWAVSSEETVKANVAGVTTALTDIIVTSGDVPIVAVYHGGGSSMNFFVMTRRSDTGVWTQSATSQIAASGQAIHAADITLNCARGTAAGTSGSRNIVLMVSAANSTFTTDYGMYLWTLKVNETTGNGNSLTKRDAVLIDTLKNVGSASSNFTGPQRRGAIFDFGNGSFYAAAYSTRNGASAVGIATVMRFSWDGTTWTVLPYAGATFSSGLSGLTKGYGFAINATGAGINFMFTVPVTTNNVITGSRIVNIAVPLAGITTAPRIQTEWNNMEPGLLPMWNGDLQPGFTLDMLYLKSLGNVQHEFWHESLKSFQSAEVPVLAPVGTVATNRPVVTVHPRWGRKYAQSPIGWSAFFATDAGMVTNFRGYSLPKEKFKRVDGTDSGKRVVAISEQIDEAASLFQGTWYYQISSRDYFGNQGFSTSVQSFVVSHPPVASSQSPAGGAFLLYGSGNATFTWGFSDPNDSDTQSALQVVVERNSDGLAVLDSGKVTSTANAWTGNIDAGYKDVELRWKVRLWDNEDVVGEYSEYQVFVMGDPPTVAITSPVADEVISSGKPAVDFTATIGATRELRTVRMFITQGQTTVYDSGIVQVAPGLTGVVPLTLAPPVPVLDNNESYTITALVSDNLGLESQHTSVNVSTSWVLPDSVAGVTASEALFGVEGSGYNTVSWPDTERDVDFLMWAVYRRVSQIDPVTQVVFEAGTEWELVGNSFNAVDSLLTMNDYYAPSGTKVEYKVTQIVDRFGDQIESADSNIATVYPVSDAYWLVSSTDPDTDGLAFRLGTTVSDSYSDEYEENEYVVVGRGRRVERGEKLGLRGTIGVQVRGNATVSARQMKRQIEEIKSNYKILYLRTPFGDVYRVSAGNIGVSRISGVGRSEFVDVEIPYTEVGV